MNYSVEFIEEAKLDFKEAFQWYESKIIGLGHKFINSLSISISIITANPYQYQLQYGMIRKALLKHFPYQVIYLIENDTMIVLGVIHSSRDPIIWENRI